MHEYEESDGLWVFAQHGFNCRGVDEGVKKKIK